MEIPVYMFVGFLESGKTTFIQDTLCDKRFNSGEKTLLLLCEEGEEEYDPSKFYGKNVKIETIDSEEDLTRENLDALRKKANAERVIVEYNGMWPISSFVQAVPDNWTLYQSMMFADATTFMTYNANMRNLVVDKINFSEMVAFNRFKDDYDKMEFHKIVRSVTRRCDIVYEFCDGHADFDDIEDPMPFDVNAPVIIIGDNDYAWFYRDLNENIKTYVGKTVEVKMIVSKNAKIPKGVFVGGRHIMMCCEQDISYYGMVCVYPLAQTLSSGDWVTVTADIAYKFNKLYAGKGPVLTVKSLKKAEPPEKKVATFF